MICQITFKCCAVKFTSSRSTLYTFLGFYDIYLLYNVHRFAVKWNFRAHFLRFILRNSALSKEFCLDFRRIVSITFVLFARFVLIFLFRNWKLELKLQLVFGWVWWNAALADETAKLIDYVLVCRTDQTTLVTDRAPVRPTNLPEETRSLYASLIESITIQRGTNPLSMQLLRFVFTSGTCEEPVPTTTRSTQAMPMICTIFEYNLFKSINPRWRSE